MMDWPALLCIGKKVDMVAIVRERNEFVKSRIEVRGNAASKARRRKFFFFRPLDKSNICGRQYRTKDQQYCIFWHYFEHTQDLASLAKSSVESIREDRESLYQKILASRLKR